MKIYARVPANLVIIRPTRHISGMDEHQRYRVLRDGKSSRAYSKRELGALALDGKVRPLDLICEAESGVPIGLAREQAWFVRAFASAAVPASPRFTPPVIPIASDQRERASAPQHAVEQQASAGGFPDSRRQQRRLPPPSTTAALVVLIVLLAPVAAAVLYRNTAGKANQGGAEVADSQVLDEFERGVRSLRELQQIMQRSKSLPPDEKKQEILRADRILQELKRNPAYDRIAAIPGKITVNTANGPESSALAEVSVLVVLAKMAYK